MMRGMMVWLSLLAVLAVGAKEPAVLFSPTSYEHMYEFYLANQERGRPTMITSDSVLHTAHVLFDYTLRAAELRRFDASLRTLTGTMATSTTAVAEEEAKKQYFVAPPPYGYARVAAYYWVANRLLNPQAPVPALVRADVEKEVAQITAAAGTAPSPIMGVTEDYTQYKPRGHYTRNEHFQRFFRAMMWYGRAGFPISGEKAPGVPLTQEEARANALAGIVLSRGLAQTALPGPDPSKRSTSMMNVWLAIYQPTAYLVGTSDDLTPPEYVTVSRQIFGETLPGGWTEEAKAKTDQFITAAVALRRPQLLSGILSIDAQNYPVALRLMGQRAVPDSIFFQQLVHPQVPARMLPSGLDVMAVLGSPEALARLQANNTLARYPDYQRRLASLQQQVNGYSDATWRKSAYLLWLRTLRALVADPALAGRPDRPLPAWWTDADWQAKQLNAGLGSWAELRHDTILYAKQSYTLLDAAVPLETAPLLYVEPVPQVYGYLANMVTSLRDELTQQGMFPTEMAGNYDTFQQLLATLQIVSWDEARPFISDASPRRPRAEDRAYLRDIGALLKRVETLPEPLRAQLTGSEDTSMALVADVHTDPNSGNVLEVAVGRVMAVSVLVPDAAGKMTTVSGPIFSYHEFPWPMTQRLTDAEWQKLLQAGGRPETTPFVLGGARLQ